jgi:hypothetical protein
MRFFFHVEADHINERDSEGIDLPSLEDARREARRAAREMVAEMVLQEENIDGMKFEIRDENGALLDCVKFKDMILLE